MASRNWAWQATRMESVAENNARSIRAVTSMTPELVMTQ